jgi:predicted ATPase/tRNA A-37 threonylcarbamoyl transferase component Bud32
MFPGTGPVPPSPGDDWLHLRDAVRRFDDAWRKEPRPAIKDHLPVDGPLRARLLPELVHIDLELRLKAGEAARVEEYLLRFPELAADRPAVLDLIAAEHELRRRGEPGLRLDEYLQRFPAYRADIPGHIAEPTGGGRQTPHRRTGRHATPPPEVPGYEILAALGRGGMGVVYKARQKSLDRHVALKFLPAECTSDAAWLERFRREALTASALNHPHICTIHDTGEVGGRPFLTMELIEGLTFAELARQSLPAEELIGIFRQAAGALAAAHAAGVVHRDIKPENVMVRNDGIVKVLDFGLARRLAAGTGAGTDPGTRVGTVLYMSPEQARGEPVGTASDIFSLGLVLYELATGRHPFRADSELSVLHAIAEESPLPPRSLHPEIPPALAGLIETMLAKNPLLRPAAGEVEAVLSGLRAGAVAAPGAVAGPNAARSALVGRAREWAALFEAFAAASAGRGSLLCVSGEPGLGKSALVEQFLAELSADGRACVARGRCSERLAGSEAYLPLLEALDSLLRGRDGSATARRMKAVAPTWYAQVAPHGANPAAETQEISQERLKRELVTFFEEASRILPVVLFLDDVHWADASTVDLLAYLGARCGGQRLLLLVSYRPTELLVARHPFVPVQLELQRHGLCREISLGFLGRGDTDRYLALTFGGHTFPDEFADMVHDKTEGNPLFLVDLLRYLRDRGVIAPRPDGWALTQAVPDFRRELPESVLSMIRKKVALLRKAELRLLLVAAVQGCEFDSAVPARVLELDPATVEERLETLERVHGLVRRQEEQEFPDGTPTLRYQFVHVLYQNTLYGALQPTRRAAWSGAVARALVGFRGDKSPAGASELALLFEAAREPAAAIDHYLKAAHNAVRVSAHHEAARLADRGLALLTKLPETPSRDQKELALLLALGVSLVATHGFAAPEVEQAYARARALCQCCDDLPTQFAVLYGLWNVYLVRGELSRCHDKAAEMHALAESRDDPDFRLVGHNVLQQPLFHRGDFTDARRHQEQGLALYDPQRHRSLTAVYGEDPGVGCQVYGAATLWHMGYPEQALRSARAARELAEELAAPFNVAQALYYGTFTHACRRDPDEARLWATALMYVCREHGFALLLAGGTIMHGWSRAQHGQTDEGIGQMREGLAAWHATGALSHRPYHLALLAETLARVNLVQEGLAALEEAQTLCASTGECFWEAELHRLKGELERARSGAAEAELSFQEALAVARPQQSKSLELRAALSLGRLLRDLGRTDEASQPVRDVYGWFTEGWDTPDLRDARIFLGLTGDPAQTC